MTRRVLAVGAMLLGANGIAAEGVSTADAKRIAAAVPEIRVRPPAVRNLLVCTRTKGFRHSSIPHGALAIRLLGDRTGAFRADVTEDPEAFAPANLKRYDAVLLLNTTGPAFLPDGPKESAEKRDGELKASLLEFVRGGKGLAGIHAATDTCYEWADFGRMIGGFFLNHPWHEQVAIRVEDPGHPVCAAFGGKDVEITDEIYQFKAPYSRRFLNVLTSLDLTKTPRKGARPDGDHAVSWVRHEGRGRVFYCSLGHREEIYWNPVVLRHYLDGLRFALGDLPAPADPDSAAADDPADPFVGEYAGTLKPATGKTGKISAKVLATGWGKYRAIVEAGKSRVELDGAYDGADGVAFGRPAWEDYVADWEVAGPFEKPGAGATSLHDEPFPPETGGDMAWRKVAARGEPPAVNLLDAVKGERRVAYLRATITSSKAQPAELRLGSDDGVKVWVNGTVAHSNNVLRGMDADQDRVTVNLVEGANTLLLKVTQGGGDWEACAAVTPKGGGTLGGLRGRAAGDVVWRLALDRTGNLAGEGGGAVAMKRVTRVSPTLGEAPPPGAVVLMPAPGRPPSLAEWDHARWRAMPDGSFEVNGGDLRSKRDFRHIKRLHVEFRVPVEPDGAGQGRGNSGVYLLDRYEVQVLDSFGKAPESHECAAIYNTKEVTTNAALPPGEWQTYDIAFTAPVLNADGTIKSPARFREVKWNGVVVHKDVDVWRQTGGGSDTPAESGPLRLQDHGHPVRYRNIWLVE